MIPVTDDIQIDPRDIEERFIRSPGPGGQKVNKTETGVQLRFDAKNSAALSDGLRTRLRVLAGRRMTADGVIVITATTHRSQELNRRAALARLVELIAAAAHVPKRRRPTRPSKASLARRLDAKKQRAEIKRGRGRGRVRPED